MRKIAILLILLLLGVIVAGSGCDYQNIPWHNLAPGSSASGSGWIYDDETDNKVTFKYKLQIVDGEPVTLPDVFPGKELQPVVGHIQIHDTSDHISIQVKSRLHGDDPATVNLYYIGWWPTGGNTGCRVLYAPDCKVNLKGEYSFIFINDFGWISGKGYYDNVAFGYINLETSEGRAWLSATEDINWKRQKVDFIEAEPY